MVGSLRSLPPYMGEGWHNYIIISQSAVNEYCTEETRDLRDHYTSPYYKSGSWHCPQWANTGDSFQSDIYTRGWPGDKSSLQLFRFLDQVNRESNRPTRLSLYLTCAIFLPYSKASQFMLSPDTTCYVQIRSICGSELLPKRPNKLIKGSSI